jgi:hypothetical protein
MISLRDGIALVAAGGDHDDLDVRAGADASPPRPMALWILKPLRIRGPLAPAPAAVAGDAAV